MILDQNQQSDAQLIGDIQNNKVGIDTRNLDFITSLLTTNLYSQPIQSFIRETVANGWDSHVEAGTTNKPVILRIYTDDKDNIHLAVRDYGTGLSPKRFNEVYLNIGSSTKRASNQYIGAFGLGRWTMLAVSNVCHLTNYYNGICSKYIAYKDNTKICIDKVFESVTIEDNGLEVDVNTEKSRLQCYDLCHNIEEGIKQLTFYDNVYVDDRNNLLSEFCYSFNIKAFNNRKIANFKTFKVCNLDITPNMLLMGNVIYPINEDIIPKWFKGVHKLPFAIKCNIGDVDITPNREQLLYNQKTIDTINSKCAEALEEFKEICNKEFTCDFSTIYDYYNYMNSSYIDIPIKKFDDENNTLIYLSINISDLNYYGLSSSITICGKNPSTKILDYYRKFLYTTLSSKIVLYQYTDKKFYVKHNSISISRYIETYIAQHIRLVNEPLKPIAKKYFSSLVGGHYIYSPYYFIYKPYVYPVFRDIVKSFCKAYSVSPSDPDLRFIYEDFVKNYTDVPVYKNSDVPQSFIDSFKVKKDPSEKATQQKARKCVIYRLINGRKYNTIGYDSRATSEDLKGYKCTIFFAEKGNPYLEMFYNILYSTRDFTSNVMLVEVAPSNLPILRELKNTIEFNSVFTEKNNIISKICTYIYVADKWFKGNIVYDYCFDKSLSRETQTLLRTIRMYKQNLIGTHKDNELLKLLCKTYFEKGWLNYTIINTIEANKNNIKINNILEDASYMNLKELIIAFYEYFNKSNMNQEKWKFIKETLKPILDEYTPNQQLPHFDS